MENQGSSLFKDALIRLTTNKLSLFSLIYIVSLVVMALITPFVAPFDYAYQDLSLGASAPSADHLLGTDTLGRDLLTRMMYGSRISLMVGFLATSVALVIGVIWGTVAGFSGGKTDAIMMRIVDTLYGIPFIILIILLMVIFGRNLILLFLAIGAVEWLTMARIVRSQVLNLSKQEFILSAEAMGVSKISIVFRHLIPNAMGPVIVYATLTVPQIMLLEAFLSFLGLGVQPPLSSWGLLIRDGAVSMEEYWWLLIFPSLAFSLTLFSLNFIGDGLRDAIDPRTADS
ncbi:ABC transporter permease [Gammaproteobacteria bacterium]|nr:ABC transporter permease [SAR86 cluster bacterium]MDB3976093.1 ABC transporter permease [Gammaproteobacteria bacterium]MDB4815821.1 ABC transporter permease [Gammaproteobacteria bacterium]MDC0509329.1 ABC transporter permease [Gammaproteobacteria bacterium]MDC0577917.1 ABC transporter permease [Gammaproteobacteria bacterium]|tara:strand:- start:2249 stop:3106 length:858 start_codon:yes stop_codon:yes gene_type:complete